MQLDLPEEPLGSTPITQSAMLRAIREEVPAFLANLASDSAGPVVVVKEGRLVCCLIVGVPDSLSQALSVSPCKIQLSIPTDLDV